MMNGLAEDDPSTENCAFPRKRRLLIRVFVVSCLVSETPAPRMMALFSDCPWGWIPLMETPADHVQSPFGMMTVSPATALEGGARDTLERVSRKMVTLRWNSLRRGGRRWANAERC